MKRFLSVLLILAMALTATAFAETAAVAPVAEEKELTNEEKLTKMLPVLDAMLRTLGVEGESTYTAEDSALVWNLLIEIAKNERSINPLILSDDTLMIVPKSVLLEYASASFFGMTELPEIPADPATTDLTSTVAYDAVTETYRIVLTAEAPAAETPAAETVQNKTVIEHYGVEAEGDLLATVALYNVDEATQTETRVGALRVKMTVNPVPGTIQETSLPLSVEEVVPEGAEFFTDPMVAEYDCRLVYPAEEPAVEPTAEPTAAPTATPAPESAYTAMQQGARGENVKKLQNRLNKLGYDCGSADGIYGANTANAVRYFQNAAGMTETGKASVRTQEKLFASDAPEFVEYVLLKKGDTGIRVENLQKQLRKLGYLAEPVDGEFGARTEEAVKLFQDAADLDVDGIAGKKTLRALDSKKAPECDVYITLKKGDTGERVTELQDKLIELGLLDAKKASGVYDKKTVAAVKAYIDANGLSGNGKTADAKLVEAILTTTKPVPTVVPTEAPTAAPTEEPTAAPTEEPTAAPTEEPAPVQAITDEQLKQVVDVINAVVNAETETKFTTAQAMAWLQTQLLMTNPTGVYDQATVDAVKLVQQDQLKYTGDAITGIVDEATATYLMTVVVPEK